MPKKLRAALRRELAVKASVDPATIEKAYEGKPVRGMAGDRARGVLKAEGLLPHDAPAPE